MKKLLLLGIFAMFCTIAFPQNGLKIKTAIPTNYGMVQNVQVKFSEFYLNKKLNSQFSVYTQSADTVPVQTFIVQPFYNFQLNSIPTIKIMWDSVKAVLTAQGLDVVDL